jgi:hypothetical protein
MDSAKKIVYMDGGLASQMSAYAFYRYLEIKGLRPEIDFVWYKRMGRDKYKLKDVFNLDTREYKGSFKYDVYISKNIAARLIRKMKLIKPLIGLGILPKIYYTMKPFWGGHIFNIDALPDETFDLNREMYFWGYWPFGDYLYEIRDILLNDFEFPQFTEEKNAEVSKAIGTKNSVSVHIRRGDYSNYRNVFAGVTMNYYKNAFEYIRANIDDPYFFIFSDEIDWCRTEFEKLGLTDRETVYVSWNSGNDSYRDMQLMSLCKNNIIANSGFSTWAAFLNKNPDKIVIEPDRYFTDEYIEVNESAGCKTYRNPWIKINN